MIELKNVTKIYKQRKSSDVKALDDVSLIFNGVGLTFIVGPSGSGKSTLLNCIGSLDKIDSGSIIVDGLEISNLKEKELNIYRNNHIGFVFQDYNLLSDYNVQDNIDIALELQGKSDDKKIDEMLASMGLQGLNLRKINELSGGEKQRVAIARALIKEPSIILADEPTGNLDSKTGIEIIEILKKISKNYEVIVVTHNMDLAKKYGDRIIEINDGKVVKDTGKKSKEKNYEIKNLNGNINFKKILKISLNNLWSSKKKVFFSVILLAISLMFMAFSLNLAIYDANSDAINTMKKNNEYFLILEKYSIFADGFNKIKFDGRDIDKINEMLPYKPNPLYSLSDQGIPVNFIYDKTDLVSQFYDDYFSSFEEIVNDDMIGEYIGKVPSNSKEIMITNHRAEAFMKYGVMTKDATFYYPKSFEELLEDKKQIKLGNDYVTIVGIVMNDNHQYDDYKETELFDNRDLERFYSSYGVQNEHIFVKGFTEDSTITVGNKEEQISDKVVYITYNQDIKTIKANIDDSIVSYYNSDLELVEGNAKDKKIIIPISFIAELDSKFNDEFYKFRAQNPTLNYDEAFKLYMPGYLEEHKNIFKSRTVMGVGYDNLGDEINIALDIIGISLDDKIHISSDVLDYVSLSREKELTGFKIYQKDERELKKLFEIFGLPIRETNTNSPYYLNFRYFDAIYSNADSYDVFSWLILEMLVVASLFAVAMLYNLIKTNINDSKTKIGTLRALGMNNKSSLMVFINEFILIDIISLLLGTILWISLSNVFNIDFFANAYLIHDNIIKEPIVVIYVLLYSLILSVITLLFIMKKITNIKPIDSILKRETK